MPILLSSLVLLCWAEWDGLDIGAGNTGHVFYAVLAFDNFVEVFAPPKEILLEVVLRKLHKPCPYICAHIPHTCVQFLYLWCQWDTLLLFLLFVFVFLLTW